MYFKKIGILDSFRGFLKEEKFFQEILVSFNYISNEKIQLDIDFSEIYFFLDKKKSNKFN